MANNSEVCSALYDYMLDVSKLTTTYRGIVTTVREEGRALKRGVENTAEHMQLLSNMFLAMEPWMGDNIDKYNVLKILNVHDQVEALAGDTFRFHDQSGKREREVNAAEELFAKFPHLRDAWDEYEAKETQNAILAHKFDQLQAVMSIVENDGLTWINNGITRAQVHELNDWICEDGGIIGDFMSWLLSVADTRNLFSPEVM